MKPTEQRPKAISPVRRLRGLGDAVHVVALPIARVVDAVSKAMGKPTTLKQCGGCKRRQEALNAKFPYEQH